MRQPRSLPDTHFTPRTTRDSAKLRTHRCVAAPLWGQKRSSRHHWKKAGRAMRWNVSPIIGGVRAELTPVARIIATDLKIPSSYSSRGTHGQEDSRATWGSGRPDCGEPRALRRKRPYWQRQQVTGTSWSPFRSISLAKGRRRAAYRGVGGGWHPTGPASSPPPSSSRRAPGNPPLAAAPSPPPPSRLGSSVSALQDGVRRTDLAPCAAARSTDVGARRSPLQVGSSTSTARRTASRKKHNSSTIVSEVRRFGHQINTYGVLSVHAGSMMTVSAPQFRRRPPQKKMPPEKGGDTD
jgi:hypothetical protein